MSLQTLLSEDKINKNMELKNIDRLQKNFSGEIILPAEIKKKYDPDNVFNQNYNIKPAA